MERVERLRGKNMNEVVVVTIAYGLRLARMRPRPRNARSTCIVSSVPFSVSSVKLCKGTDDRTKDEIDTQPRCDESKIVRATIYTVNIWRVPSSCAFMLYVKYKRVQRMISMTFSKIYLRWSRSLFFFFFDNPVDSLVDTLKGELQMFPLSCLTNFSNNSVFLKRLFFSRER